MFRRNRLIVVTKNNLLHVGKGKIGKIICKPGDTIYDKKQDKLVVIAEEYYGITFKDVETRFTFNSHHLVLLNVNNFRSPTAYEKLLRHRGYDTSPEEAPESVDGTENEIMIKRYSIDSKEDIVISFIVNSYSDPDEDYGYFRKPNAYEKRKINQYLKRNGKISKSNQNGRREIPKERLQRSNVLR